MTTSSDLVVKWVMPLWIEIHDMERQLENLRFIVEAKICSGSITIDLEYKSIDRDFLPEGVAIGESAQFELRPRDGKDRKNIRKVFKGELQSLCSFLSAINSAFYTTISASALHNPFLKPRAIKPDTMMKELSYFSASVNDRGRVWVPDTEEDSYGLGLVGLFAPPTNLSIALNAYRLPIVRKAVSELNPDQIDLFASRSLHNLEEGYNSIALFEAIVILESVAKKAAPEIVLKMSQEKVEGPTDHKISIQAALWICWQLIPFNKSQIDPAKIAKAVDLRNMVAHDARLLDRMDSAELRELVTQCLSMARAIHNQRTVDSMQAGVSQIVKAVGETLNIDLDSKRRATIRSPFRIHAIYESYNDSPASLEDIWDALRIRLQAMFPVQEPEEMLFLQFDRLSDRTSYALSWGKPSSKSLTAKRIEELEMHKQMSALASALLSNPPK
jgi:hypothetical protein